MLDIDAIKTRLDKLDELVSYLQAQRQISYDEYIQNATVRGAVERYLQLAIQCVLDIGNILITGLGLRRPEKYEEILDILRREGIISADLGQRLQGIAGFRNILVHLYLEIKNERVYETLIEDLPDLEEFARQIVTFLDEYEKAASAD